MIKPHQPAKPVFILGNPRSGTTMLRLMLTSHEDIGIPPESEFIVRLFSRYGHLKSFSQSEIAEFRNSLSGDPIDLAEQWEVPLDALFYDAQALLGKPYAEVCASIYRAYQRAKGLAPTQLWGDKNNAYSQYVDLLARLYPEARFVHLLRDGRAVLNSYRKLSTEDDNIYAPVLPKDAFEVALRWTDTTSRIERHLRQHAVRRWISIRYEDLLEEPEAQSRHLCKFLDLPYDPSMLEFHLRNSEQSLEPKRYGWKANTFLPLDKKKSTSWLTELSPRALERFESIASPALRRYGYEPVTQTSAAGLETLKFRFGAKAREMARRARLNIIRIRGLVGR